MTRQGKMSNFEFRRANIAEQVVSCLMRKLLISIIFCTNPQRQRQRKVISIARYLSKIKKARFYRNVNFFNFEGWRQFLIDYN